jgi:hypothetical protein
MHRNVETLIGRLATDARLRDEFTADPAALLAALLEDGVELTEIELEALAETDSAALQRFAQALDPRLRKARLARDRRAPGGTNDDATNHDEE